VLLPMGFGAFMAPADAASVGGALASMLIYVIMAGVLVFRPSGLFPAG
jgi:branched-chain amino acid transport system permease protein